MALFDHFRRALDLYDAGDTPAARQLLLSSPDGGIPVWQAARERIACLLRDGLGDSDRLAELRAQGFVWTNEDLADYEAEFTAKEDDEPEDVSTLRDGVCTWARAWASGLVLAFRKAPTWDLWRDVSNEVADQLRADGYWEALEAFGQPLDSSSEPGASPSPPSPPEDPGSCTSCSRDLADDTWVHKGSPNPFTGDPRDRCRQVVFDFDELAQATLDEVRAEREANRGAAIVRAGRRAAEFGPVNAWERIAAAHVGGFALLESVGECLSCGRDGDLVGDGAEAAHPSCLGQELLDLEAEAVGYLARLEGKTPRKARELKGGRKGCWVCSGVIEAGQEQYTLNGSRKRFHVGCLDRFRGLVVKEEVTE